MLPPCICSPAGSSTHHPDTLRCPVQADPERLRPATTEQLKGFGHMSKKDRGLIEQFVKKLPKLKKAKPKAGKPAKTIGNMSQSAVVQLDSAVGTLLSRAPLNATEIRIKLANNQQELLFSNSFRDADINDGDTVLLEWSERSSALVHWCPSCGAPSPWCAHRPDTSPLVHAPQ